MLFLITDRNPVIKRNDKIINGDVVINYSKQNEMELIVSFNKSGFTPDGTEIKSGKVIFELQKEWEELFHDKFDPLYANVIEGHPAAMQRITGYFEFDESGDYDFGMELIDGEIDIETNLEIEEYSDTRTVYAIGSQLKMDEDGDGIPILLVKNDKLKDDILVLKYVSDENGYETENVPADILVEKY